MGGALLNAPEEMKLGTGYLGLESSKSNYWLL